jgi:oligopeptide/dipeptide ABC transporter ATP-binding protein
MSKNDILLSVKGLSVSFPAARGVARVLQDVSFSIRRGRTFALVGESGCGKTVTALSIMRLLPANQGRIVRGEILFEGQDLLAMSEKQMRQIRGNRIAMIFQEPMTSLNPVYTVGQQIAEAIKLHQKKKRSEAWADAVEMLQRVGIADSTQRACEYPHQMSGGMLQRVMIAMAVSCEPALLIADEPTSALDVTTQTQILALLDELQKQSEMSILLITHDLAVVADRADELAIMYASRIVEMGHSQQLLATPLHPYTQGLLRSLPQLHSSIDRLPTIPGTVPNPLKFPSGCKFHPRCPFGQNDTMCRTVEPALTEVHPVRNCKGTGNSQQRDEFSNGVKPMRRVACWYAPSHEAKSKIITQE